MRLDVHIHHHRSGDETILSLLESIMHTLDDVLAEVTREDSEIGGITALINGLRKQVADAVGVQTIPPAVQSKIDAIFDAAVAHNAALVQALQDPGVPQPVVAAPGEPEPNPGPPPAPVASPAPASGLEAAVDPEANQPKV